MKLNFEANFIPLCQTETKTNIPRCILELVMLYIGANLLQILLALPTSVIIRYILLLYSVYITLILYASIVCLWCYYWWNYKRNINKNKLTGRTSIQRFSSSASLLISTFCHRWMYVFICVTIRGSGRPSHRMNCCHCL